jgi:hypothetical protein
MVDSSDEEGEMKIEGLFEPSSQFKDFILYNSKHLKR